MRFKRDNHSNAKVLFTFFIVFSLIFVTLGPISNAVAESGGGNSSGMKVGIYYWMRGDGQLQAVETDATGFRDTLGFDEAFTMSDTSDPEFPYSNPLTIPFPPSAIQKSRDDDYLEQADFIYFAGHGAKNYLLADLADEDLNGNGSYYVEYNGERYWFKRSTIGILPRSCSWGDGGRTKWVALATCYGTRGAFEQSMKGINLLLGWSTWCDDAEFGAKFASYCKSDMTIRNAWFRTGMEKSTTRNLWMRVYARSLSCGYDTITNYQPNQGSGSSVHWDVPVNHFPNHISGNVDGAVDQFSGSYVDDTGSAEWSDIFPINEFINVPGETSAKATALNYLYSNKHVIHENDTWGRNFTANVAYQKQSGNNVAAHVFVIRDNQDEDETYMKAELIIVNNNHIVYCDIENAAPYEEDQYDTGGDFFISIEGPDNGLVDEELTFTVVDVPDDVINPSYTWIWENSQFPEDDEDAIGPTESHSYGSEGLKQIKLTLQYDENGTIMEKSAFKNVEISDGDLEILFRTGTLGLKPVPPYQVSEGEDFVVVVKSSLLGFIEGATVTFDGQTDDTNELGRAFFEANSQGKFEVTAEFGGFTSSRSITIHQGRPMQLSFSKVGVGNKITVGDDFLVTVKGYEGPVVGFKKLDGATVTFDDISKTSGSWARGKARFTANSAGTFTVTAEKDGYASKSESITIFEEGDDTNLMNVNVRPGLILVDMPFVVSVKHGLFGISPLADATVTMEDTSTGQKETLETGAAGLVSFTAPSTDQISIKVQHEDYPDHYETIPIYQGDMSINVRKGLDGKITLDEEFTVVIRNTFGSKLGGVTVTFDGQTETTPSEGLFKKGKVKFKANNEGTFSIKATLEDYPDASISVMVYSEDDEGSFIKKIDASMPLTIDLPNDVNPSTKFTTIPKSYGKQGYSMTVDEEGTYSINDENGVTLKDDFESPTDATNWLIGGEELPANADPTTGSTDIPGDADPTTGSTDIPGDEGDDDNQPPVAHVEKFGTVVEGQTHRFYADDSYDPDGSEDDLKYKWKWDGHNYWTIFWSTKDYKDITFNSDGQKQVWVKVKDSDGDTDTHSITFNVQEEDDDDCCFPAGTLISMADGSLKPIEDVKVGEYVLSYDDSKYEMITCKVLETVSPLRKGVYNINDGLIRPTDDHPFYTRKSDGRIGWASINPDHSEEGYGMKVMPLGVGDEIFTVDQEWIKISSIEYEQGQIRTYNLEDVSGKSTFFANGILVHNAVNCGSSQDNNNQNSYSVFYDELTSPDSSKQESSTNDDLSVALDVSIEFDGSGSYLLVTDNNDDSADSSSLASESDDDSKSENDGLVNSDADYDESSDSLVSEEDDNDVTVTDDHMLPPIPTYSAFSPIGILKEPKLPYEDDTPYGISEDDSQSSSSDISSDADGDSTSDSSQSSAGSQNDVSKNIKYIWDFGDGSGLKEGLKPEHTYEISEGYSLDDLSIDNSDSKEDSSSEKVAQDEEDKDLSSEDQGDSSSDSIEEDSEDNDLSSADSEDDIIDKIDKDDLNPIYAVFFTLGLSNDGSSLGSDSSSEESSSNDESTGDTFGNDGEGSGEEDSSFGSDTGDEETGDDSSNDIVDDTSDDQEDDSSNDIVDTSDDEEDDSSNDIVDDTSDDQEDDSSNDIVDTGDDEEDDSSNDIVDDTSDDQEDDSSNDLVDTSDDEEDDSSNDIVDTSDTEEDDSSNDIVDDTSDDSDSDLSSEDEETDKIEDDLNDGDKDTLEEDSIDDILDQITDTVTETVSIASGKITKTYSVTLYMVYDPDDEIKDLDELSVEDIGDMIVGVDTTEITVNIPIQAEVTTTSSEKISSDKDDDGIKDNVDPSSIAQDPKDQEIEESQEASETPEGIENPDTKEEPTDELVSQETDELDKIADLKEEFQFALF